MTNIPIERLCYFFGSVKQKGTFSMWVVHSMPFDAAEVLNKQDPWEILKGLAVEHLKKLGELPANANPDSFEKGPLACFRLFKDLQAEADEATGGGEAEEGEIVVQLEPNEAALDKVVMPSGFREQIVEVIGQFQHHKLIFETWGLGEIIKKGHGINMLFTGPPGTGKTHCAETIAEYLGCPFEIITAAQVESKWVGESEKNVASLFQGLRGGNKVLVIDEADSFLTSRSNLAQHHEGKLTNQILVELERHRGIVILTTNRPIKLDKAVSRRIDLVLQFPVPPSKAREKIWRAMTPKNLPKDEDLDYTRLSQLTLTGGQIKNVMLAAARSMAQMKKPMLTTELVLEKAEREMKEDQMIATGGDHT